jgi:hypothetical protein
MPPPACLPPLPPSLPQENILLMKREKKKKMTPQFFTSLSCQQLQFDAQLQNQQNFPAKIKTNKQTNKQPAENKTNEDARTLKHEDKARNPTLPSGLAFFLAGHKMRNAKLKSVKKSSPFLRCSIALIRKIINKKISTYF